MMGSSGAREHSRLVNMSLEKLVELYADSSSQLKRSLIRQIAREKRLWMELGRVALSPQPKKKDNYDGNTKDSINSNLLLRMVSGLNNDGDQSNEFVPPYGLEVCPNN